MYLLFIQNIQEPFSKFITYNFNLVRQNFPKYLQNYLPMGTYPTIKNEMGVAIINNDAELNSIPRNVRFE